MPVFNDAAFYLSGGYNSYSSPYSPTTRNALHAFPQTNFNYSNAIGTNSSGVGARYKAEPKKFTLASIGGRSTQLNNPYVSNYVTYADWKENLLFNKMREDTSYRWKDKNRKDNIYRANRPVFIDTSKIDVCRPRRNRENVELETSNKQEDEVKQFEKNDELKGTISRGRTVVRIHTKALKENPYFSNQKKDENENKNQNQKLLSKKKSKNATIVKRKGDDKEKIKGCRDDDYDSEGLERESTIKPKNKAQKEIEVQREGTLKGNDNDTKNLLKSLGTIVRKCKIRKRSKERRESVDSVASVDEKITSRKSSLFVPPIDERKRLSMELFEEQAAILDNLIKEELAKRDEDDYFSDPKRGTVKISAKQRLSKSQRNTIKRKSDPKEQCAESSTTDDDLDTTERNKRTIRRKSRSIRSDDSEESSASSRRSSLFQDLFIEATIAENGTEELEDPAKSPEAKPQKKKWKIEQKSMKPVKNPKPKPFSNFPKISAIVEMGNKPKPLKFFIENISVEVPTPQTCGLHSPDSPKIDGDNDSDAIQKQDTVKKALKTNDTKSNSSKNNLLDKFKKTFQGEVFGQTIDNKLGERDTIESKELLEKSKTTTAEAKGIQIMPKSNDEKNKNEKTQFQSTQEKDAKRITETIKLKTSKQCDSTAQEKQEPKTSKWKFQLGKKSQLDDKSEVKVKEANDENVQMQKKIEKERKLELQKEEEEKKLKLQKIKEKEKELEMQRKKEEEQKLEMERKQKEEKKKEEEKKMKEMELKMQKKKKLKKFKKKRQKFEEPELKKIEILILPQPSQAIFSESNDESQVTGTTDDASSVSESGSDSSDLETEDENESHSDSGLDKLRPSYSNDSGFGSAYHKHRTGIY